MWRLGFVLCPLLSSAAYAAESKAQFQVGIVITGKATSSAAGARTVASASAKAKTAARRPGPPMPIGPAFDAAARRLVFLPRN